MWEDQCTMVETTVTRSQCQEVTSEQCSDTQEWVCEDDELGLETLEYGAPQAPTITQSSQVSAVLISKYLYCNLTLNLAVDIHI